MDLITGNWIGEFTYGDGYGDDLRGRSVKFSMNLYYDGNILKGTSMDEEAQQFFRQPAIIEGTFENKVLVFYLTYQLNAVYGSKKNDHNYSSEAIQYIGHLKKKLFSKSHFFEGIWEYSRSYLGSGVWKMQKAKKT